MQAAWLAPARGRLLRLAAVARRRRVLDLGAGYGAVTSELARRSSGYVVALDCNIDSLREDNDGKWADAWRVAGDARALPVAARAFDLVFCQCVLMWVADLATAVAEIRRVLQPGAVLMALEPDYDGLIEYPAHLSSRPIWLDGLRRAGADPLTGRKLPDLLARQGFDVRVNLLDTVTPPASARFDFLRTLPLTAAEQTAVSLIEEEAKGLPGQWQQVVHLPFFLITATV
jgi:SAM-dependent methyltransferase